MDALRTTGMYPINSNPTAYAFSNCCLPHPQAGIDANNTKAIEAGQVAMTRLFVLTYLQGTLEYAFKMGLQVANGATSFPAAKKAQVGAPAGLAFTCTVSYSASSQACLPCSVLEVTALAGCLQGPGSTCTKLRGAWCGAALGTCTQLAWLCFTWPSAAP